MGVSVYLGAFMCFCMRPFFGVVYCVVCLYTLLYAWLFADVFAHFVISVCILLLFVCILAVSVFGIVVVCLFMHLRGYSWFTLPYHWLRVCVFVLACLVVLFGHACIRVIVYLCSYPFPRLFGC